MRILVKRLPAEAHAQGRLEAAAVPWHLFQGPLYVDLDGTLIASDLLHESAVKLLREHPRMLVSAVGRLASGKAAMKQAIAAEVDLDVANLPYRPEVLDLVQEARRRGRRVVLATASDIRYARAVADHLGMFDAVLASSGDINLSGSSKLRAIQADAALHGGDFAYAGDRPVDRPIWAESALAIVVSRSVSLAASSSGRAVHVIHPRGAQLRDHLYGLRLHQWVKNTLVALPMLPALRDLSPGAVMDCMLAFLCFGLAASSIYVINDLLDLEADRRHPRKRFRPYAAGLVALPQAALIALSCLVLAFVLAIMQLPAGFTLTLAGYVVLTTAYSMWLKRRVLVDVFALTALYTTRIVAGAAAVSQPVSLWILCFSIFVFLSLALAKRYAELTLGKADGDAQINERGYSLADAPFVMMAGIGTGQISALVLALYLIDPLAVARYQNPRILWLVVPIMLFWITRIWLKASRGQLHDDPVVFTLRDHVSRLLVAAATAVFALAVWTLPW